MYWLRRPPYLRYAAAAAVLVGAAWLEFNGPALVAHPYAVGDIDPGTTVAHAALEWREVPAGLLPPIAADSVFRRSVERGSPVLPADLGDIAPRAPEGWWGLEVPLPQRASVGQSVQLVVLSPTVQSIPGVVLEPGSSSEALGFSSTPGLVAVPPDHAVSVALAVAEGRLAVLIEP